MSIGNFDTSRISKETTMMLCILIGITAGLIIYSSICPPPGHIDEHTLKLVPWTFAFCSLFVAREAIKEGLGVKYTHGETSIEIDKDKEESNG